MKVVVAIPARNSGKTINLVYNQLPKDFRKHIVLSDDGSSDNTKSIAQKLGMKVFSNPRKAGYGSNVKNCLNKSLQEGADIVVILHSDNQYDPKKVPELVRPIQEGKADFVIGSRMLGDEARGMSAFRFTGNRFLGFIENLGMGTKLTDLHSGMIAMNAGLLRKVSFNMDSDDYGFHTDFVLQSHYAGARFMEIGIPTRYEEVSTSINIYKSVIYGLRTLQMTAKYLLNKYGIIKSKEFISISNKKLSD